MNAAVTKTYLSPPFCEREILRYAGVETADGEVFSLLDSCLKEVRDKFVYKVCYREFSVRVSGCDCDFGEFRLRSKSLAQNLSGCDKAIVFAATVGVEIDRLIAKYGRLSPSKALMLQAIGTERIEALCDVFCKTLEEEKKRKARPRFSAGYGDLPLEAQREIFAVLDCAKRIGVCLNESMLMSPSKSVTAFVGLSEIGRGETDKCGACSKMDCAFRSKI